MSILSEIVDSVQNRVEVQKNEHPLEEIRDSFSVGESLRESIEKQSNASVIGELKQRSPSRGRIRSDFGVSELAKSIDDGGASGVSVLTEPEYFGGKLGYLGVVRNTVDLPVLRKDFIIEKYQLYRSAEMNASAVLLIFRILDDRLPEFVDLAWELGMESFVEIDSEEQIDFVKAAQPELVGVNNRNLETLRVDLSKTVQIAEEIPSSYTIVSESGISSRKDIDLVLGHGADAVLVGTAVMRSENVQEKVRNLVCGDLL